MSENISLDAQTIYCLHPNGRVYKRSQPEVYDLGLADDIFPKLFTSYKFIVPNFFGSYGFMYEQNPETKAETFTPFCILDSIKLNTHWKVGEANGKPFSFPNFKKEATTIKTCMTWVVPKDIRAVLIWSQSYVFLIFQELATGKIFCPPLANIFDTCAVCLGDDEPRIYALAGQPIDLIIAARGVIDNSEWNADLAGGKEALCAKYFAFNADGKQIPCRINEVGIRAASNTAYNSVMQAIHAKLGGNKTA